MPLVLFLVLAVDDSLPPLPDPSVMIFPEPPAWSEPPAGNVRLNGFCGQDAQLDIGSRIRFFDLHLGYADREEWTRIKTLRSEASPTLPLPYIWLKPSLAYFRQQAEFTSAMTGSDLALSCALPWFIVYGNAGLDRWTIDNQPGTEACGLAGAAFDRSPYLPRFELGLAAKSTGVKLRTRVEVQTNRLHLSCETYVRPGFPSPKIALAYRTPAVNFTAAIRSGIISTRLRDRFIFKSPVRYATGLPDESLKIGSYFAGSAGYRRHSARFSFAYESYYARLLPDPDFRLAPAGAVNQGTVAMNVNDSATVFGGALANDIEIVFNWASRAVPLEPRWRLRDTLVVVYRVFRLAIRAEFLARRMGVTDFLPAVLIVDPAAGIRIRGVEIYGAVFNLTGSRREYYDGYRLAGRRYAAGTALVVHF